MPKKMKQRTGRKRDPLRGERNRSVLIRVDFGFAEFLYEQKQVCGNTITDMTRQLDTKRTILAALLNESDEKELEL